MNNTQKVSVELKNGKFMLANAAKIEDLNPKALIICAAAECAGYTIMHILRKDNVILKSMEITVEGTLDTPMLAPESQYVGFNVRYNIDCKSLADQNTVSSAVRQAQEYQCGVIAMLRRIAPVSHDFAIVSTETVKI